jgi:hypothetical protein
VPALITLGPIKPTPQEVTGKYLVVSEEVGTAWKLSADIWNDGSRHLMRVAVPKFMCLLVSDKSSRLSAFDNSGRCRKIYVATNAVGRPDERGCSNDGARPGLPLNLARVEARSYLERLVAFLARVVFLWTLLIKARRLPLEITFVAGT